MTKLKYETATNKLSDSAHQKQESNQNFNSTASLIFNFNEVTL